MACENNPINYMQEFLQSHCPTMGMACDCLYRLEETASPPRLGGDVWQMRVVLINTGQSSDEDMRMPWSAMHTRKIDAKKDAARMCLGQLIETGVHPHDPTQVPLAVGLSGGGGGGGDGAASAGVMLALPDLTSGLLDVQPVLLTPTAAIINEDEDDEPEGSGGGGGGGRGSGGSYVGMAVPTPKKALTPANLGKLGEEYAANWLGEQPWIVPGSVRWLNAGTYGETGLSYDIECEPSGAPGRRHVEVKTKWRHFHGAAASTAQRARLLDPDDNYMLLIVGFFENLFESPPTVPQVRLLPNTRWEHKQLPCELAVGSSVRCHRTFTWSILEQQEAGAIKPGSMPPPVLCKPCRTTDERRRLRIERVHLALMAARKKAAAAAVVVVEQQRAAKKTAAAASARDRLKMRGAVLRQCTECDESWVYDAHQRNFMKKKGWHHPKRCKPCRAARRGVQGRSHR